jgi:tripartite ATP-independent transporter DctM subunit
LDFLPVAVMFLLFAINVPVALAIAMAALSYFLLSPELLMGVFVQRLTSVTVSFPLLAVPFFILAGTIMNHAGITRRLMTFADALVGHMVGGLAKMNVLLSTFMGGLSASANADAAMQAKMVAPEMIRRGYRPGFTAAVTACSAVITPILPPGIGLIIYGFLADVSVGRLFIGGIVPSLLLCAALMGTVHLIAKRHNYRPVRPKMVSGRELWRTFIDSLGALSIAAFIILGIRFGVFTPTEAGALVVLYALFLGLVVYRELKVHQLPAVFAEAALATAVVMIIISAAAAFGFYMAWERIPALVTAMMVTITDNPILLLLLINLLLLLVGMLIEGTAALILLTPILVPVVTGLGIDPIHFGLVVVLNLTIGGVTPPVGTIMYTTCSVMRVPVDRFTAEGWALILSLMAVLLLVTLVPELVLFLPRQMMG